MEFETLGNITENLEDVSKPVKTVEVHVWKCKFSEVYNVHVVDSNTWKCSLGCCDKEQKIKTFCFQRD